ncbi:translocation/assembly module TamB domain-containing protein [Dongshaea marina]|uniref:translocation/assembly module TamB domain-containing protein n=1 Tax=Dongshaea marina TaxID=2047966 RepID=UPI000D3E3EA9|nr:translocation/assembly module TamB domain-containing protein [Dongshaea marina]
MLEYRLRGSKLKFQSWQLSSLKIAGSQKLSGDYQGHSSVELEQLRQADTLLETLQLRGDGNLRHQQLSLDIQGKPISGHLSLKGDYSKPLWHGELAKGWLNTQVGRWQLEKPLTITLDLLSRQLKLSAQCWRSNPSSLCLEPVVASPKQGQLQFKLSNFSLKRLGFALPEKVSIESVLGASGRFQWQQGLSPSGGLKLALSSGKLQAQNFEAAFKGLNLDVALAQDRLNSRLDFESDQLGKARVDLLISQLQSERNLQGEFKLSGVELEALKPFIPGLSELSGAVDAQTRIGGTLKQPLVYGAIHLKQGELIQAQHMVSLSDWQATLKLDGSSASLESRMKAGQGSLALSGDASFEEQQLSGELRIKGDNAQVQYPGMASAKISPDLRLELGKEIKLTGQLTIPWARIAIKTLPKSAVPVSNDLMIVKNGRLVKEDQPEVPLSMRLKIVLGDDVRLEAMGLKSNLGGALTLRQQPNKPMTGSGEIEIIDGTYKAYGQDLQIDDGKLFFAGPLDDPNVQIKAQRPASSIEGDVQVWIELSGSANDLQAKLMSDPDMSDAEKLSYLLRGRGFDQEDSGQQNAMLGALLVNQGIDRAGGLVEGIVGKFGVSDVGVDTMGTGDNTQVAISGYLSPKLRLSYGMGVFSTFSELQLRYELLPKLYLQAASGVAQALDLLYQFDF